ncbi:MAG TPA: NAD-dependent epimerase/dehydratase family protein [Vicinamibacterales bacterium]|nr:NAD-dependent epimerase/dehydratase family protein [Thermoanaerobaculia bacterium]HUK34392.1 NAD-dependent epimerase/dehydratase family protein [Vicinamibacterales bacterium]
MNALVTGANGFVGRALCEELRARGVIVRAVVRSPVETAAQETSVVPDFERADWPRMLHDVDCVFHLAALAHVPSDTSVARLWAANVRTSEIVARAAARARTRRLVFLSTTKVHGDQSAAAGFREDDPLSPDDAYGMSKAAAEIAVAASGAAYTIVRPPLVYGPAVRANFLALMRAVDRMLPLPAGNIRNLRSTLYVRNLADAMLFLAQHAGAANEAFGVSDFDDLSTPELLRRIGEALGKPPRLFALPSPALRLARTLSPVKTRMDKLTATCTVDTTRIRRLGWAPPYTMKEALQATALWYRRSR